MYGWLILPILQPGQIHNGIGCQAFGQSLAMGATVRGTDVSCLDLQGSGLRR